MSGRLIILPKKSYNPWNPQNTERVQRDERLHKERIEKEEEERRIQDNKRRIQLMKERMKRLDDQVDIDDDDYHAFFDERDTVQKEDKRVSLESSHYSINSNSSSNSHSNSHNRNNHLKHVNLFEEEEKQMLQNFVDNTTTCKSKGRNNEKMKQSVGILPVFLTERPGGKNVIPTTESKAVGNLCDTTKPFYERDDCLKKDIDDKVKIRYDPMSSFVKNCGDSGGTDYSGSVLKTIESKSKQDLQKSDYRNVHKGDRDRKMKKRKKDDSSSRSKGKNDEKYSKSRRRKRHESDNSDTRPTSRMDELKARKLEREQSELNREEAVRRA